MSSHLSEKTESSDALSCPFSMHATIGFLFPSWCRIIPRTDTLAGAEALWLIMQVSWGCPEAIRAVGHIQVQRHPFS